MKFLSVKILSFFLMALIFRSVSFAAGYQNLNMMWKGKLNPDWIGAYADYKSGFTSGLGTATLGLDDGMFTGALYGVAVDSLGNIYSSDWRRINKYNSAGVFQGWIGRVENTPTGGAAGCTSVIPGGFTPGWCTGGKALPGFTNLGDGSIYEGRGLAIDSANNIYVIDHGNNRVNKYNSSGQFIGWIGHIFASPTSGEPGCAGALSGTFTPGWCKGGSSTFGPIFNSISGLAVDSLGNVYVTSAVKVIKFNSSGNYIGWIGKIFTSPTGGAAGCNGAVAGTFTPGWCTGGVATFGTGDGHFYNVVGIAFDAADNLYVTSFNRIMKLTSAGTFLGWIGKIATSPTGGAAGCNGAAIGSFTPGWCTGGTPADGSDDGMLTTAEGIFVDAAANIYVTDDFNKRVSKFDSAGAFIGWAGLIAVSPTGGEAGCNGAAIGTVTPGWCKGGRGAAGSGDGMLNSAHAVSGDLSGNIYVTNNDKRINRYNSSGAPTGAIQSILTSKVSWSHEASPTYSPSDGGLDSPGGIVFDSSNNAYVFDSGNYRISKFGPTGIFLGWIGNIGKSPTGGAAGCAGAAVGTFTPGWCIGGESAWGSGDGMIDYFYHGTIDSSGNLYVADVYNHRISKFTSSGAFVGWFGRVFTSPTGGNPGCAGAAIGSVTPGWCTGGTSQSGKGDGAMSYPYGVHVDSLGNILVADNGSHRINKYNAAGIFVGWIGNILTSPTGGAPGCAGAPVGTFTPGWCLGGTSTDGAQDGMMDYPDDVATDNSGNIYVADADNYRISKYSSTGQFLGWIGQIDVSPTGGDPGCAGASVGTFTPGWCTGGEGGWGEGDGMFDEPMALVFDKHQNIYVADSNNNRLSKFSIAGKFLGWIGEIGVSPTGGATGCNGADVGTVTPGWCKGGSAKAGSISGSLDWALGVSLDSKGNLYGADANSRIIRYPNMAK